MLIGQSQFRSKEWVKLSLKTIQWFRKGKTDKNLLVQWSIFSCMMVQCIYQGIEILI